LRAAPLAAAILTGACATGGPRSPGGITPPSYGELAAAQNRRVEALGGVSAGGTLELRWRDETGSHFEQGDLDLAVGLPDRFSMALSKFGERLLWLGARPGRAWLFDFRGGETALYCAEAGGELPPGAPARAILEPSSLLALAGLARLPELPIDQVPPIEYDTAERAWTVRVDGPDGPLVLYLDRRTTLPVRVDSFSEAGGELSCWSRLTLSRYDTVSRGGPMFPTLLDIHAGDGSGQVKISVYDPADAVKERLFDLEWLIGALKPSRIEGLCGRESR
jgi:hypothetical protein